jgi:hypothetical protein
LKAEPQGSIAPPPAEPIAARVAVLTLLYSLVVLMLRSAEGASLSLFLEHLGVENLPYTFLAISLVDLPLAFVYMKLSPRIPNRALLAGLAILLAACLGGARLLADIHTGAGLFAAYTAATIFNTFMVIQWGVVLLDFFTIEESRRAFPLVYAGAHLGGFGAGLLLRHLALPIGSANLLVIVPGAAALLVAALAALTGRLREGRAWRQGEARRTTLPALSALGKLALFRKSSLLRAIAAATAVMVLLRLGLRYCYGAGFADAFPSPDDLTRFIGTYTMIASIAGVVLQVLAAPALLRRLGVPVMNVIYALAMCAAFTASWISPGLASSIAGRFTDMDFKSAIKTPLSAIFYEAMGDERRSDARALILGIVSPLASFASSLILVAVAAGGVPPGFIAAAGSAAAVVFLVLSWLQGRSYRRALRGLLLGWFRKLGRGGEATLEDAVREGLRSQDRRIADMASEVRRGQG